MAKNRASGKTSAVSNRALPTIDLAERVIRSLSRADVKQLFAREEITKFLWKADVAVMSRENLRGFMNGYQDVLDKWPKMGPPKTANQLRFERAVADLRIQGKTEGGIVNALRGRLHELKRSDPPIPPEELKWLSNVTLARVKTALNTCRRRGWLASN